jgi:uncharacterized protein with LGFP repeats
VRALWICVVATAFVVARPDVPAQAVAVFSVNLHSHTGSSSGSGTPLRTEMADVIGAIREKWLKLGGEGFFGHAIDIERPTFDGVGRAQQFSGGGIISWHPAIGAFAVWGQIGAKWVALGREKYGYPITDELTCGDGRGRLNHFRSMHLARQPEASIYWSPATGAHEVRGAIRATWFARGAERGPLGYPTSDEHSTGRGDERRSNFVNGRITWTSAGGVRVNDEVIIDHGTALNPVPPER